MAVSGGVDSVVLLDLLVSNFKLQTSKFKLVVAHFDHGIRTDASTDRKFVQALAKKYDLPFEYSEGRLGPQASEALAREKRYEFLRSVRKKYKAKAIITAHHEDDLLETAIINLLRGTGRRGLSSLSSNPEIKRPLLGFSKKEILSYARKSKLNWREDPTNRDEKYLRNWVRHNIIPVLTSQQRKALLGNIRQAGSTNITIEKALAELLSSHARQNVVDRIWFNRLPYDLSKELLMTWLRQNGAAFNRKRIEQLVVAAKTYAPGKKAKVSGKVELEVGQKHLALVSHER